MCTASLREPRDSAAEVFPKHTPYGRVSLSLSSGSLCERLLLKVRSRPSFLERDTPRLGRLQEREEQLRERTALSREREDRLRARAARLSEELSQAAFAFKAAEEKEPAQEDTPQLVVFEERRLAPSRSPQHSADALAAEERLLILPEMVEREPATQYRYICVSFSEVFQYVSSLRFVKDGYRVLKNMSKNRCASFELSEGPLAL